MSERMYGKITIGGSLYRKDLDEFLALAIDANRDEKVTEEWIPKCIKENGELLLQDPEANYGQFTDLEAWCENHDLTYRRESEGKYEYDPETVYWTPGMPEAMVVTTDHGGNETIRVKVLSKTIQNLKKFLKKCNKVNKAPLHINDKDDTHKLWAKHILATNKIDQLELIELWLQAMYPDTDKIPAFAII